MSNLTTNANVTLQINGQQAQQTLAQLRKRQDEPFVTINTVTGDAGIKKAQDEYAKLMANKSPKSRL